MFFNSDLAEFERVAAQGDQALRQAISAATYPDGAVVTQERLLMDAQKDSNGTFLSASMSYYVRALPSPSPCRPPDATLGACDSKGRYCRCLGFAPPHDHNAALHAPLAWAVLCTAPLA